MIPFKAACLLCLASLTKSAPSTLPGFSLAQLDSIQQNLARTANKSWEIGVQMEALIELRYPQFSVFYEGTRPNLSATSVSELADVYTIVESLVDAIPAGQLQIMEDAAAGDPNALIPPIYMAAQMQGSDATKLMAAVDNQLTATLLQTPRSQDGAISQRVEYVQLWSDFIYMVPPALAYVGAMSSNLTLLQESFQQCQLYSNALLNESVWMHVVGGPWNDLALWSTGTAWAANGQMRVLAAAVNSPLAANVSSEIDTMVDALGSLLTAAWAKRNPITGMLPNDMSGNATEAFSDTASTALLAATSYRFAAAGYGSDTIAQAEFARIAIQNSINAQGWLLNVVNPLTWTALGTESPEAQAFVLIMQASWYDWVRATNADVTSSTKRRRRRTRIAREKF